MSDPALPSASALVKAVRAQLMADPDLAAAVAGFHNVMPPREPDQVRDVRMAIQADEKQFADNTTPGAEHELKLYLEGDYRGQGEGNLILWRARLVLEAWSAPTPVLLDGHRLVNLEFVFADVSEGEGGKSYEGVSTWRAVTHRST